MHVFGLDNLAGPFYGFWSGSGSDLQELPLFATPFVVWKAVNCHTARCWRIGIHHVAGGQYRVCRKHHREVAGHPHHRLSLDFIKQQHEAHARTTPGVTGEREHG